MFRNCFLFNVDSMLILFLMFLLLTHPLLKNNSLGLEGKPVPVTYSHSARPLLSRSTWKTGPSKCWKIFPLCSDRFDEGGWGLKRNGHWPFCVTKVGMDIVPYSRSQLENIRKWTYLIT